MGASKRQWQEIEEQRQYAREILEELLDTYPINRVVNELEKIQAKGLEE